LSSILWSIPFLFEFKLFGIDFLPDLLGIALLFRGLLSLKKESSRFSQFKRLMVIVNIMLGWAVFKYALSVTWLVTHEGALLSSEPWIAPIVDIITLLLLALIVFEGRKALQAFEQIPIELNDKLITFGNSYSLYTIIAIAIRGTSLFYDKYFDSYQWILFAFSIYYIIRFILIVRQVFKVFVPEKFEDALQPGQVDRTSSLSSKATGSTGFVLAIISILPIVGYVLFFWYIDSTLDKSNPTAGAGIGYAFAYIFVLGASISVIVGIVALLVTKSARVKTTLSQSALIIATLGMTHPFLIMFAMSVPGRLLLWAGI
jgi:hypothetical protein